MKKILLVEDDPVIIEIYRKKFEREGYEVFVSADGLAAVRDLNQSRPDLVILDLMLPKFNGADVLKYIRSTPALKDTKVAIFSNAYMTEVAVAAAKAGADASLLKSSCTPAQLLEVVKTLLDGGGIVDKTSPPAPPPPAPTPVAAPVAEKIPPPPAAPEKPAAIPGDPDVARPFVLPKVSAAASAKSVRYEFIQHGVATLEHIRSHFQQFADATDAAARTLRLKDFHRQVHFFADHAAVADCRRLAHLAAALEALLFELQEKPHYINSSVYRTIGNAIDLLRELFRHVAEIEEGVITPTNLLAVLVVDDEPLSNRALVHALSRANVKPASTESGAAALQMLQEKKYDLLLLDYLMPGMDGLELYQKLRALPQYAKTPVIFVTNAADFRAAHEQVITREDDVITKPIFPIELAVKSLTLLLKRQLAGG